MNTSYVSTYDPDTDFDRWHTIATGRRIAADIEPGQSLLELGCATGLMTLAFAEAGAQVLAIDRAEQYLERARARQLANVELAIADITLFEPGRTFDHVVATNVLHEVPDPLAFLRTCRRHLAPGGRLHITLQNPDSIHRLVGLELGMIGDVAEISDRGKAYDTLRMLGRDELGRLFEEAALEVVARDGVLLKPLPNDLMDTLPDDLVDGLARVGHRFAEHCSMNYFALGAAERRADPSARRQAAVEPPAPLPHRTLDAQTSPDPHHPHLSLWNTTTFYQLRPGLLDTYLRIDHHDAGGRLVGSFVGSHVRNTVVSGASAPMGGIELARGYETTANIGDLFRTVSRELVDRGITEVEVRMKGPHFSESEPGISFTLLNAGFTAAEANLNFFVDLRDFDSIEDYHRSLKKPARRATEGGQARGLITELLAIDDEAGWADAYGVLHENRSAKGRPTSLTLDYVRAARDAFPGLIRMLAVRLEGTMIASALVYRVAPARDVVQFWGDARHDLDVSPMNFLAHEVVAHALDTGCAFLDLGISTDHGRPNHGLIQFKRSIGARSEVRPEYVHRCLDQVVDR